MKFNQALEELKDPYKGMSKRDRRIAMKKDKEDEDNKKREKNAFAYAASLLDKK